MKRIRVTLDFHGNPDAGDEEDRRVSRALARTFWRTIADVARSGGRDVREGLANVSVRVGVYRSEITPATVDNPYTERVEG